MYLRIYKNCMRVHLHCYRLAKFSLKSQCFVHGTMTSPLSISRTSYTTHALELLLSTPTTAVFYPSSFRRPKEKRKPLEMHTTILGLLLFQGFLTRVYIPKCNHVINPMFPVFHGNSNCNVRCITIINTMLYLYIK